MIKPCNKCGDIPNPLPPRWKRKDYTCNKCHRFYCKSKGYKGAIMPREWHKAYGKEYYARPEIKKHRAAMMREYSKNPKVKVKQMARWQVNRAIASG